MSNRWLVPSLRPRLFGPILRYDLVRSSRRGQFFAVRFLYLLALGILFGLLCAIWYVGLTRGAAARELVEIAGVFAIILLCVQFSVVVLLAPLYTAATIAEEKERKTLEYVLTTDLSNAEIVLGKLTSRLASLALLVLAGVPIFFLMTLLGGVDPALILGGSAAALVTMVSLAGMGILCSVYARRMSTAVLMTYAGAGLYLAISYGIFALAQLVVGSRHIAAWLRYWGIDPPALHDRIVEVGDIIGCGNVFLCLSRLTASRTAALADEVLDELGQYATFHLLVGGVCAAWAVARVRAVARKQSEAQQPRRWLFFRKPAVPRTEAAPRRKWLTGRRRRVGQRPVLWKEAYLAAAGFPYAKVLGWLAAAAMFAPPVLFFGAFVLKSFRPGPHEVMSFMNGWSRVIGAGVGSLLLLMIALRSAGAVSGERSRQTLDSLLLTTLDRKEILRDKAVGSVLRFRGLIICLFLVWLLAAATGGLHPVALPFLIAAWLVYAAALTVLALWFSLACRSTLRAIAWTIGSIAVLSMGHWLLWIGYWIYFILFGGATHANVGWLRDVHLGFTPPGLLFLWCVQTLGETNQRRLDFQAWNGLRLSLLCLAGWAVGTLLLWRNAQHRFRTYAEGETALPDPKARRQPRWRRSLRLAVRVAAILVVLAGAAWLIADRKGENRLREAIAETDALDPDWRLEDLERQRTAIPEPDNGALVVLGTAKRLPADWPPVADRPSDWNVLMYLPMAIPTGWPPRSSALGILEDQPPAEQFGKERAAQLRATLHQTDAALAEAVRLAHLPRGRFPVDWQQQRFAAVKPHIADVGRTVDLLTLAILQKAQESSADEALELVAALLNAGRALGDEPSLASQEARSYVRSRVLRAIERTLAQGEPALESLERTQRLLEADLDESLFLVGTRGERARIHELMSAMETGDAPEAEREVFGKSAAARWGKWLSAIARKHAHADALRFTNELVKIAARKPQVVLAPRPGLWRDEIWERFSGSSALVQSLVPHQNLYGHAVFVSDAVDLRCAIVALACERYRREQGQWPRRLDALVPTYLSRVPDDPFDGKPLRYRRPSDGVIVYSIGNDHSDDNGKLNRNKRGPYAWSTDEGIQLWNPEKRRQQPKTGGKP